MIKAREHSVSFADLELQIPDAQVASGGDQESALSDWYAHVRRSPIAELPVEDVARACRQLVFLDYVVPRAVEILKEDVCAGGLYEGELVVALTSLTKTFWGAHPALSVVLSEILSSSLNAFDADVKEEARRLLAVIQQVA